MKQVHAPAFALQRQRIIRKISRTEVIERQQGVHAGLFALPDLIAQLVRCGGQRGLVAGAGHVQRRHVDQQVGQQFVGGGVAFAALRGQAVGQPRQGAGVAVKQHAQFGVQLLFAIERRRDRVEFHHRMQAQPGHRAAPLVGTVGGRVHEVQHGQQGPAAGGQDGEFSAASESSVLVRTRASCS
ncbi:hypothetical protein G6F40_014869 [Rhizopus arrhizus]|nr:hypothetical protein G6F40_014869 [Rhizopus arrhizus]